MNYTNLLGKFNFTAILTIYFENLRSLSGNFV